MTRAALAAAVLLLLAGCAAEEPRPLADGDPTPISGGVIVDSAPTTAPVEGSPAELLADMAAEMSRLSALVVEDRSSARSSLERITAIWAAVEADLQAQRPGLVNGVVAAVDLAETSVERNRPADADKAFSLLTDLVDAYTGDG